MNAATIPSERWSAGRWLGLAAVIFVAQLGVFFLLGKNSAPENKSFRPAPVFTAVNLSAESTALENPTFLALPSRHGFSGAAWLKVPFARYEPTDWSEPERWLPLRADELGSAFRKFIETSPGRAQIAQKIEPKFVLPRLPLPDEESDSRSTFRVHGRLASRALLSAFELRSWTNAILLTNSVVQLIVDEAGFTRTATLLASSGFKEADDEALALSKAARFGQSAVAQTKKNSGELTLGQIIFEWHTMPLPATNILPAAP